MSYKKGYLKGDKLGIVETSTAYLKLDLQDCRKRKEYRQTYESNKENVEFTDDSPAINKKEINNSNYNNQHNRVSFNETCLMQKQEEFPNNIVYNQEYSLLTKFFNAIVQCWG
jgi:hypothetical protein